MSKTLFNQTTSMLAYVDAANVVWTHRKGERPRCSHISPAEFAKAFTPRQGCVRILGARSARWFANTAVLIRGLAATAPRVRVQICAPLLLPPASDSAQGILLSMARIPELPASQGGWADVTDAMRCTVELGAARGCGAASAALVEQHPLWAYASFVAGMTPSAFVELVTTVVDPRWYIKLSTPDSTGQLEQYMGVHPKVQAFAWQALQGTDSQLPTSVKPQRVQRSRSVLQCWHPSDGKLPLVEDTHPQHFVVRAACAAKPEHAVQLARGSQRFLRYIHAAWLNVLVAGTAREGRLFVPKYFFRQPDEVAAFTAHIAQFR